MGAVAERPDPRLPTPAEGDRGTLDRDWGSVLVAQLDGTADQIRAIGIGNDDDWVPAHGRTLPGAGPVGGTRSSIVEALDGTRFAETLREIVGSSLFLRGRSVELPNQRGPATNGYLMHTG
jgi:hypothetical protein